MPPEHQRHRSAFKRQIADPAKAGFCRTQVADDPFPAAARLLRSDDHIGLLGLWRHVPWISGGSAVELHWSPRNRVMSQLDGVEQARVQVRRQDRELCDERPCEAAIDGTMVYCNNGYLWQQVAPKLALEMHWVDFLRFGARGNDLPFKASTMTHCKRFQSFLLAICLGFFGPAAMAQAQFPLKEPNGFTWGELALLPEYCKDTQGTVWALRGGPGPMAPDTPRWVAAMGEGFFAAHHYCYGLRNILRADIAGIRSREGRFLLTQALDEFRYMFRNASPSMPLMPEIYLKEGETHLKLGNLAAASASFERSRRLKPDYWPAYTRWADALLGLKLNDRAKALLLEGYQHAPSEPELVKRLTALGVDVAALPVQRAPSVEREIRPADAASAPAAAASDAGN